MNVAARVRLAAEILYDYARIRRGLRHANLPDVLSQLRDTRPRRQAHDTAPGDGARLARAVVKTLEPLPVDSRCLMRSLVLLGVLSRRGVAGSLVIAVRPEERDRLDAHAWVEVGGRPLLAPAGMQDGRLVTL
jgi:hypothetical protein